jgi:shikimate 5-dehydrogenase
MLTPAIVPTMYFIGVTTKKSSIMKVFPAWMKHFGIEAKLIGIDLLPRSEDTAYREVVSFIKADPLSLGALVTTHKIDCFRASMDLFDGIGPYAQLLLEASSISKRGPQLWAHAKDPITSGLGLEHFIPKDHFAKTGSAILLLGAGGSSLALTLYLINKAKQGGDVPSHIIVTNRSPKRIEEMKELHATLASPISFSYAVCLTAEENNALMANLPAGSLVINATGLGKDGPGSPITDEAIFPADGFVWEFNYRGELHFLTQAREAQQAKNLTIIDGWQYFIYGWTQVIAEVFHIAMPVDGPEFDTICDIALDATQQ